MQLPSDFRDLISAFNAAGVEYLIIGGYAMAAHGHPRFTGDIDFFFNRTNENAGRIILALKHFGYSSPDLTVPSLTEAGMIHYFGRQPLRVDLLNTLAGVDFDTAWLNRLIVDETGIQLPIMNIPELIANKRAVGRPKDLADLETLESVRPPQ